MLSQPIQQQKVLRVLVAGFTLVILLLLTGGFVGLRNIYLIKESTANLVAQGAETTNLVEGIRTERAALDAVFHKITRTPESIDREKILSELDETGEHIAQIVASAGGKPDEAMWRKLGAAVRGFSDEARRLLSQDVVTAGLTMDLSHRHEEVISLVRTLVRSNDLEIIDAQKQIAKNSAALVRRSVTLFGTCLLGALLCAFFTVRVSAQMFRQMQSQASELSRVSWHMLENQETTARRFSHELHDELGQSLTAVKANLAALDQEHGPHGRLEDCLQLVNEAIANVRQLSQLLRPTILDDFGLDAALRSLCERFMQRTRIEVEYESTFSERLPDETETHLFRIAQEALTNIAQHSGASRVRIQLHAEEGNLQLSVSDNGRGLQAPDARKRQDSGLGMTGMRARARMIGGELQLESSAEHGLTINVRLPWKTSAHGDVQKDPHLVSR